MSGIATVFLRSVDVGCGISAHADFLPANSVMPGVDY